MKYIVCFLIALFLAANVRADIVKSCDGQVSAHIVASHPGLMVVERKSEELGSEKIDHDIIDGVFDSTNKLLVVHGLPNKSDPRSPQADFLSIYSMKPKLRLIMRRTYGGGIYDVAIGIEPNLIFVASRFGFDVINIKTMKIKSSDPISEPQFSRQQCKD